MAAMGLSGCAGCWLCVCLSLILSWPVQKLMLSLSLAGFHVLGLPRGIQEADGAAAAHGVAHRGDAL